MAPSRVVSAPSLPAPTAGIRQMPVQQRSSARLDRVLTAAAGLVDELGYDDVTTALIADRAGVSIGTIYRFFDDKPAIFRALSARHFQMYVDALPAALAYDRGSSVLTGGWRAFVDVCVDVYVGMVRDVAGFRGFGDAIDRQLLATELGDGSDRDNDTVLADRLLDIIGQQLGVTATPEIRLALIIAVTTADALLALAFRRDPAGDETVIAETKTAVAAYLAPHLGA